MAAAAMLNFQKVLFLTPDDTYVAHIHQHIKFDQELAKICLLCIFQDGGRRHLEFLKSDILEP